MLLVVAIGLLVWAMPKVSMNELLAAPANRPEDAAFLPYFMAALTAMPGGEERLDPHAGADLRR